MYNPLAEDELTDETDSITAKLFEIVAELGRRARTTDMGQMRAHVEKIRALYEVLCGEAAHLAQIGAEAETRLRNEVWNGGDASLVRVDKLPPLRNVLQRNTRTEPILVPLGDTTQALQAIPVPYTVPDPIAYVRRRPDLHYIVRWGVFAIQVGPLVLCGNIGKVGDRLPCTKECWKGVACQHTACPHYHGRSNEIRNFMVESWVYTPPYTSRVNRRPLGSREHLDVDLAQLQQKDVRLLNAQLMHDLLCLMLAEQAA